MFIKGDFFDRLLCCRRKVSVDENEDKVEEEIVLQHTNNNKTEYITSTQLMERLKGGTTAVVALVREKRLVVAWLGDSLALLVRKRTPVHIVQPHKPDSYTERKRIEDVGGCVLNIQGTWRVLGQLAISRAIGDVQYKPYVTSECDIKSLEICGDEDFLILACDGLWDNLSPESAVNIVYSYLAKNDGDTDGVGRCLVEAARSAGSEDNITTVVVFLRPVSVLMEEESARVAQGQVPEMEPFVVMQKDALPPSINAIFSPQQNFISPPTLSADVPQDLNGSAEPSQEPAMPVPAANNDQAARPQDYDSDEGVGADIAVEKDQHDSPEAAAQPTDEEVDAALAELDSIPDGGCDAGEVDDDDEDEEWSYYKMEPQKQTQNEDLIVTASPEAPVDVLPGDDDLLPQSPRTPDSVPFAKESSPCGSPPAPSSPRTVEGFVTSVELNTPEESYNTNLAINQTTEYFNGGGQIEQNSGPFSVYVSSSPEPASIESPPVNMSSPMSSPNPPMAPEADEGEEDPQPPAASPSVEIVHAQSTVEVLASPSLEVDLEREDGGDVIPDLMTQSMTGELSSEPFVVSGGLVDDSLRLIEEESKPAVEEVVQMLTETQLNAQAEAFESRMEDVETSFQEFKDNMESNELSEDLKQEDIPTPVHDVVQGALVPVEEKILEDECVYVEETVLQNLISVGPTVEENLISVEKTVEENHISVEEPKEEEEIASPETPNIAAESHFPEMPPRAAFEAPLDPMVASFHEDRTPVTDLISSPTHDASPVHVEAPSPVAETPSPVAETPSPVTETPSPATEVPTINLLEPQVEKLTQEVSQLELSESPKEEVEEAKSPSPALTPVAAPKPEAKKPASAPRTTLSRPAAGPPKPSPRSVGAKPTSSRVSSSPAPSPGARTAPKRPTSLSTAPAASKPLRKTDPAAKPSSATTTSLAKSRASTTTRASSASATRTTSTLKSTTTSSSSSASAPKARTAPRTTTGTTAPPTRTKAAPSAAPAKTSTAATPRSRSAASTTSSAPSARRLTSAPRSTTATSTTSATKPTSRVSSASKIPNGASSTRAPAAPPAAAKRPLPSRTSTSTTSSSRLGSASAPRKPLGTAAKTAAASTTTSTLKQRTTPSGPTATKDNKNSTNRMLSTSRTTSTTRTTPLSSTRTTTTTTSRTRTSPLKTSKTSDVKSKAEADKTAAKAKLEEEAALANGENKIVEEESSVEVKEKVIAEESVVVETSSEMVIEDVSVQDLLSMKQEKVLVNGDH